ncbi:hypothetical protein [Microbacterium sp. NPDC056052]|uniref:hypothetical protein n=1 Tax=Microbacterium sp. NPDC056052 TaxID=3345695 RepID=UPI0035DCE2CA
MTVPTNRPAGSNPFDAGPLTAPIDRAALAAFARSAPAGGSGMSASQIIALVFGGIVVVFILGVAGTVFGAMISTSLGVGVGAIVTPLLILVVVAGVALGVVFWLRSRRIRAYRLAMFAAANGMSYLSELSDPQLPGMIFGLGHGRRSSDLVRGTSPRFVEFANYRYTTGSGKNAETHAWGYIAIKLDVPLPNIVLDSLANNGFLGSNLPASYSGHQRLSLEGDFDQYFALYCPEGYERDALYLFTPDIMARFMDNAATFDVEVVDDWLFLYAQRQDVSTLEPDAWARAFATVGAVIDKLAQWARWRDERLRSATPAESGTPQVTVAASPASAPALFAGPVAPTPGDPGQPWSPPPGVAPGGRRLKRAFPWVSVLVFAGVGISWLVFRMMLGH